MGDNRFRSVLEDVQRAFREGRMNSVDAEAAIQALGALASQQDGHLANALATRLLNQFRRSSTLLQYVADGVVALDDDGRVLFANPAAEAMLGRDREALIGRDFHDTVGHRKSTGEEISREECVILRLMDEATIDQVRVHDHDLFERADGTTFMVGLTAAAIVQQGERTGVAVVFRDITQQQENEARLALFGPALDAIPMPVFALRRDGGVLYANEAAAAHLGHPREALTRMRVFDFDIDYPVERWDDYWARIKRGEIRRIDTRHRVRDGRIVPVHVRVTHVERGADEFHIALAQPGGDGH